KLGRDWERTEQKPSRSWAGQEWPDGIFRLPVVAVPSDLLVAVPAAPGDLPVALWGLPVTSPPRGVPTAALAAAQVTSEDQEVPEHKPVELRCAAFRSSSGSARIEWKFQRGSSLALIYYGGELTEPYRDRVQFSPTSIRFGSVTREDSGKYICEVVGDGSHIAKSEVNLIVQVPPGKPLVHVPSSATVGARAVLRCSEAQGSPPPTFRWYKDGTELPQDPKSSPAFRNSSYSLDPRTGELVSAGPFLPPSLPLPFSCPFPSFPPLLLLPFPVFLPFLPDFLPFSCHFPSPFHIFLSLSLFSSLFPPFHALFSVLLSLYLSFSPFSSPFPPFPTPFLFSSPFPIFLSFSLSLSFFFSPFPSPFPPFPAPFPLPSTFSCPFSLFSSLFPLFLSFSPFSCPCPCFPLFLSFSVILSFSPFSCPHFSPFPPYFPPFPSHFTTHFSLLFPQFLPLFPTFSPIFSHFPPISLTPAPFQVFEPVGGWDTGDYHCEASNNVGSPQKSDVFRMEASEVNVGGIVAAVVLLLLVLGLAAFGIWFAHRRGYFSSERLGGTGRDWEWTGRDWEGLGGTGNGLGRDWEGLGMDWEGLGMDWEGLGGTGNGLGGTGMDWEGLGMDWGGNGRDWDGTGIGWEWTGRDWEGLGGTGNGLGGTGRDWEWTGRDWEWTGRGLGGTGNGLGGTGMDWEGLGMDWGGNGRTGREWEGTGMGLG
uniref:Uncharacterized protein n=1 Tax=Geospiza parvula TaxID=87175 RepID=A0A8C3Q5T9_GEOPR